MEDNVDETTTQPMRRGRRSAPKVPAAASAWPAFNIALSAVLYLFDFVTNLITLRTYYFYSISCNKFSPQSHHIPHECDVIFRYGHRFSTIFYVCLSLMLAAHFSNTLIFWFTLHPSDHPLRLAYFLPLIHLSRLLKVLWFTCSCNSLEDMQARQKETSNLYNVLAASLETAPQLMLQFHVILEFGDQTYVNKVDEVPVQHVPKTLILSLLASLVSGTYNGSVAVLSLVQKRGIMPLQWIKACILILAAGLHILTAMSTKFMIAASLAEDIIPVWVYGIIGLIVTWIFFAFVLQKRQHDSQMYSRSNHKLWILRWMIHGVHSLALAHVSMFIGPMYNIVKLFDRPACFLMWGTLLHMCVDLLGFGAVVVTLGANRKNRMPHWPAWETTCYHRPLTDVQGKGIIPRKNVFLSCNGFIEALCTLILLFLVSTLVFANMVAKRDTDGESERQLVALSARQEEHQILAVLDAVNNQMETCTTPAEYNMPKSTVEVGSPNHFHSLITYDKSNKDQEIILLPSRERSSN